MSTATKRTNLGHNDGAPARRERPFIQEHGGGRVSNQVRAFAIITPEPTNSSLQLPTPPKDKHLPPLERGSRIPTPSSFRKPLSSDKPLPSPPIATFTNHSPFKEARCLIDASEVPLRRSPSGDPDDQEDWPVLSPARPVTAIKSSQTVRQNDRSSLDEEATNSENSDMPIRNVPLSRFNPARRSASIDRIWRKPVVASDVSAQTKNLPRPVSTVSEPTESIVTKASNEQTDAAGSTERVSSVELTFNGPTVVEKPMRASRDYSNPRQTKTSALRARLSAGKFEIPSSTEPGKVESESTSVTNPESRGPVPGGPANKRYTPTLINVQGRRTPTTDPLKQQNSRRNSGVPKASLHSSSGISKTSPYGNPPTRPAPSPFDSTRTDSRGTARLVAERTDPSNRSASAFTRRNDSPSSDVNTNISGKRPSKLKFPTGRGLNTSRGIPRKVQSATPLVSQKSIPRNIEASDSLHDLSMIEGQEYKVKRLSKSYPDGGPILKISASAERVIMGEGPTSETRPRIRTKRSRDLRRSIFAKDTQNTTKEPLPPSNSRLSDFPPTPPSPSPLGKREETSIVEKQPSSKDLIKQRRTSSQDSKVVCPTPKSHNDEDPFFDTPSRQSIAVTDIEKADDEANQSLDMAQRNSIIKEEGAWISSSNQKRISLARSGSLQSSLLKSAGNGLEGPAQAFGDSGIDIDSTPTPGLSEHENLQKQPELGKGNTMAACLIPLPCEEISSCSLVEVLPPRASSRTVVRDYASDSAGTTPSLSPPEAGKKLEREFSLRQDKLGNSQGVGSSQLDVSNNVFNRSSIASTSNKSQRSLSKAMLSNFKGLFHKRPSDFSPGLPVQAGKTASNCSSLSKRCPLPPMSEVHPIHRPIAISKTRPKVVAGQFEASQITKMLTPSPPSQSPGPSQLATTTDMAMAILDQARIEASGPRKENLVELGKLVVDAVTQARDAEKAMEEAKQAARKAEVAYALCAKSVSDVAKSVQDWRRFVDL